jgi:hypothetical protein
MAPQSTALPLRIFAASWRSPDEPRRKRRRLDHRGPRGVRRIDLAGDEAVMHDQYALLVFAADLIILGWILWTT